VGELVGGYRRHLVVFTVALAIVGAGCSSSGHSASAFCKELQRAGASGVGVSLGTKLTTHPGAEQLVALDLEIKKLEALAPNPAIALSLESYDHGVLVSEQTGDNQPILRMTGDPLVQPFVQYAEHDCQLQSIVRVATSTTKPSKDSGAAFHGNTCALATEAQVRALMNTYLSAGAITHKLANGQCTWETNVNNEILDVEFTVLAGNTVAHRSGDDKITGLGLDNSLHYGSTHKEDIGGIAVAKGANTLAISVAGGDGTKSNPYPIDNAQKKSGIITLVRQGLANI
jgi:hypothetical protein